MSAVLINVWSIFLKGGPVMWPLLVLSVLAIAIIIDKWLMLVSLRRTWVSSRDKIFALVRDVKLKEALIACDEAPMILGRVLKTGILKYGSSRETVVHVMEQSVMVEVNELKQRMSLLATIVNLAPLLGLLATVIGLTVVFQAVHMRSNALNPLALGDMASGIWQALVATSAGLGIGIVAFVGHAFLTQQINDILMDIDESVQALGQLLQSLLEGDHAR